MKEIFQRFSAFLASAGLGACPARTPPASAVSSAISPRQVWKYRSRPGEESSRIIVGKIEEVNGSMVIHVKLIGVKIRSPQAPSEFISELAHIPISEESFRASIIEVVHGPADLENFEEGYSLWKEQRGGVFTISAREIVDMTENAMKNPPQ